MSTLQTLSFLIHARAKQGKSTLGATSPPPVCIFDAEGSTKFLTIRMVTWDPVREPPPVYDGSWDAAIVNVTRVADVEKGLEWLISGQHHFRSVVVDSVTEVQRKLKTSLVGAEKMQWDNWDDLLRHLDVLIRGLRDLTQHPTNPLLTATFIVETKQKDGRYIPNLQGQIASSVPYWFDVVGYMIVEPKLNGDGIQMVDETGRRLRDRKLLISEDNFLYEAGHRVAGRLPDVIPLYDHDHPEYGGYTISSMLTTVFPALAG